ncbi:MAG: AmmeMemoRadiSam system radical SAM enzyme [Candidatus Sumerlaeia bacterium]|nr:AmmeMemoRadiSam system radical SAM enzyme [Candidatus Sumerlaeia bacterium]
MSAREAMLYSQKPDGVVECRLCHHRCTIRPGNLGICQVRENQNGTLVSLVYRRLIAQHVDPIEKKPLFHFLPGSVSYSIATAGCNFRCLFCQNYSISQMPRDEQTIEGADVAPERIVAEARARRCATISYTYTEPTIFFEYAYDIGRLAHEAGIRNVWVSNGYMTPEALDTIAPYLDAINVDLKAFNPDTYQKMMGAKLDGVLETLRLFRPRNIWLEVTTLVVPAMNDSDKELNQIAEFVASLGTEVPWHVSRFHPDYKIDGLGPTPVRTLERAVAIGRAAGLKYVYSGNVPGDPNEHTYCPSCGKCLIERIGFSLGRYAIENGACKHCHTPIDGVWE